MRRDLSPDLRSDLRDLLLGMHQDPEGREELANGHMSRFARVQDSHYDTIRDLARLEESVGL